MANFSKFGFILATLGSSIGLGHIWRFPYMTGNNGGSAFVVLYLFLTLTIGISMLLSDMIIGNRGRKNIVSCFGDLYKNNFITKLSGIFLLGGPIILSFYSVVLGWVLYYLFVVSFQLPTTLLESQQIFTELKDYSIYWQIVGFSFCLILTSWIVCFGIKKGIEKLNFVLMPLLFIIFIGLLVYAMTIPSFMEAFKFMFDFAPEKITLKVIVESLGQVFFSLSLGVGTIITYAAFTHKNENLLKSSLWVVLPGILISLVAGLMIFTFIFEYGGSPQQGDGLVFISLPLVFGQMGITGEIISILFLVALMFAGVTSTVSLLEPSVVYLIEKFKIKRSFATLIVSGCVFIVGILIIFSLNVDYAKTLTFLNKNMFAWADFLTSSILMPLGGLFSTVFVGYVIGRKKAHEYTEHFLSVRLFKIWYFLIRYIIPVVIIVILISQILHSF
ncbi:sodium-and chloride-dependent transporter [Helicobacter sp. 13S00482-2]|uniref:sodium-dependent transporter n=1 Tax=Helicobacter sp. 13S00482-2 TaxID=1476200 RepID=UPI000BA55897|nr:sodium-dependent transporter [Helicobacter sp. 13S00482-2]PAF54257.1 sodium-and chloride-dependent transporter [Helicobacter sp. 13S00482-2]